ncbi:MAG: hypothetical protein K0R26_605 [Bacteroidota bacterium]|jgi:hypothetical protein|nr:hypothetical protein [Bacteroidota bacterium]
MAGLVKLKRTFVFGSMFVSLVSLMTVVSFAIIFSNRGFELSDETYYLFFSNYHNPGTYMITNFGLLNDLFCFGNPSLINLRLAKLFYQSAAVLFFCYGVFRYLKFKGQNLTTIQRALICMLCLMLSYINYDYLPMTLSYNSWTLILGLSAFSMFFIELTSSSLGTRMLIGFFIGFILFCFFLVKLPGLVFFGFFYAILSLFHQHTIPAKLVSVFLGMTCGYFIFLNDFQHLENIITDYYITIFEVKHVEANSYLHQFRDLFYLCEERNYILVELVFILVAVMLRKANFRYKSFFSHVLVAINLCLLFVFRNGNSNVLHNDFLSGMLMIVSLFIFTLSMPNWPGGKADHQHWIIATMLISTPFLLMIGTNNSFYYTASHLLIFAYVGALLFTGYKSNVWNVGSLALNTVFISCFIVLVLYHGAVKNPYRQSDLTLKMYPLNFSSEIKGIVESKERFIDYQVLNRLVSYCNPRDSHVVTTFNYFGLCFLNDIRVFPESQISDAERNLYINKYVLDRFKMDDRFDLVVIPETVKNSSAFKDLFGSYGVNLGDNYRLFYQYRFLSTGENIYFYKHV